MSIVYCKKSRRQFLVGTGQTLLALPLLPSLFSSEAEAQVAYDSSRKLMIFWTDHANAPEFWPQRSFATNLIGSSGTRERLLSELPNATNICPLMTHPIYNTLRSQNLISIVRGMEVHRASGHGPSPLGGVYDYNLGNLVTGADSMPTFDSVIDTSTAVYPSTTPSYVTRGIRIAFNGAPAQYLRKVGTTYQPIPHYGYDQNTYYYNERYYTLPVLFEEVFRGLTTGTTQPADMTNLLKTNILNRVYESYSTFRSGRRISMDDRSRLEQHMSFISDLQRRLNVTMPTTISCNRPNNPVATIDPVVFTPLYLDLLAVAFRCGLTKFGSMYFDSHSPAWLPGLNLPQGLELHGAIHGSDQSTSWPAKRHAFEVYHQYILDQIGSRFLAPLNEIEGNSGRTYLDNMITVYLSQMGMESINGGSGHSGWDMQQMMFGSMGGRMRAGRYMALPNTNYTLLPYNAFLVTLLQLMGVPSSDYQNLSNTGQGYGYYNAPGNHPLASRFYGPISELLSST